MGYADDLVVLAKEEKGIKWLFEKLERNLKKKTGVKHKEDGGD